MTTDPTTQPIDALTVALQQLCIELDVTSIDLEVWHPSHNHYAGPAKVRLYVADPGHFSDGSGANMDEALDDARAQLAAWRAEQ